MKDDAHALAPSSAALARRLWRDYLATRKGLLVIASLLMLVTAAATSSYALLITWAAQLFDARDPLVIWLAPLALAGAALVSAGSLFLRTVQTNRIALETVRDLQGDMFASLQRADLARLSGEAAGSLVSRFTNDVNVVREALLRAANNLIRDVLIVMGTVAVMFWLEWMLALLVLVAYPLAAIPVIRLGARLRRISAQAQEQMGQVSGFLEESLSGARMVKAYGLQTQEQARAAQAFERRTHLALTLARGRAAVDPILEVFGGLALAGVFAFAGWRAVQGAASFAELAGFLTAIAVMAPRIRAIGTLNAVLQEAYAALERVFTVIDERPRVADAPDAAKLPAPVRGHVELRGVSFAYAADAPALRDVSLEARPGETVALVGPSGAGKSSVLNLILRFHDPNTGAVLVDGRDLRDVTLESARAAMALVSQDVTIFDASAAENIGFGRPGATRSDIEAAAHAAAAHDFIAALPGGYDAPLGPRGARLSGGQRQRIALARAFLRDAPILLLDEATSALDSESERQIQAALAALTRGRTVIVIAHRLSTVARADRIYVLDQGRIVESGTHDALVRTSGLYAQLAALQFRDA
jgi:subfamily B ATP-binding cassette protein MsbA